MSCFVVPAVEAVAVTIASRVAAHKEQPQLDAAIPASRKLGWLAKLLWGGSALLAFEHLWHGELVPSAPFLTAMSDPAQTSEMLNEMGTVGVSMAILTTVVWFAGSIVAQRIVKRPDKPGKDPVED